MSADGMVPQVDLGQFEHGLNNDQVTSGNTPVNPASTLTPVPGTPPSSAYQATFDPSNKNVFTINTGYNGTAGAQLVEPVLGQGVPLLPQQTDYTPYLLLAAAAYFLLK